MDDCDESCQTRATLQVATELLVVGGYTAFDPAHRAGNEILASSRCSDTIAAVVSALSFTSEKRMDWMTPGSPALVFLKDRKVIAEIRCILPGFIRCSRLWEDDAVLVDDSFLVDQLRLLQIHPGLADDKTPNEPA